MKRIALKGFLGLDLSPWFGHWNQRKGLLSLTAQFILDAKYSILIQKMRRVFPRCRCHCHCHCHCHCLVIVIVIVIDSSVVLWSHWNQKWPDWLTHWLTRSPIELSWTAKKQGWLKVRYNVWNRTFKYEKIELLVCIYEIPDCGLREPLNRNFEMNYG